MNILKDHRLYEGIKDQKTIDFYNFLKHYEYGFRPYHASDLITLGQDGDSKKLIKSLEEEYDYFFKWSESSNLIKILEDDELVETLLKDERQFHPKSSKNEFHRNSTFIFFISLKKITIDIEQHYGGLGTVRRYMRYRSSKNGR